MSNTQTSENEKVEFDVCASNYIDGNSQTRQRAITETAILFGINREHAEGALIVASKLNAEEVRQNEALRVAIIKRLLEAAA